MIKAQSEAEEFIFWGDVVIFGEMITKGKIKGDNDFHFNAVIELLGATLQELGVTGELIQEVGAIGKSARNNVLN